jgi:hypothetical protein
MDGNKAPPSIRIIPSRFVSKASPEMAGIDTGDDVIWLDGLDGCHNLCTIHKVLSFRGKALIIGMRMKRPRLKAQEKLFDFS